MDLVSDIEHKRLHPFTSKAPGHGKHDRFGNNPALKYSLEHSSSFAPSMLKLIEATTIHERAGMMGCLDVLSLTATLMEAISARNVLDVGVFTGLSALNAALHIPDDGKVIGCDTTDEFINSIGRPILDTSGVGHKIDIRIAPALDTLNQLINEGREGQFDFAFIDADKPNYMNYYELCLRLLRPRGMIVVDNTLWSGRVFNPDHNEDHTVAIRELNEKMCKDSRVQMTFHHIGDGVAVVTKL